MLLRLGSKVGQNRKELKNHWVGLYRKILRLLKKIGRLKVNTMNMGSAF